MKLTSWLNGFRNVSTKAGRSRRTQRRSKQQRVQPAQAESLESRMLLTNVSFFFGATFTGSQANAFGLSNTGGGGNGDLTVDANLDSFGTSSGGFETQGEVTLSAGRNINFNAGQEVRGTFLVELNIDEPPFASADPDPGTGGTLNLNQGSVRSSVIEFNGNEDNDTFNISDSAIDTAATSKTVDGRGGTDTLNINLSGSTGKDGGANATLTHSFQSGFGGGPFSLLEYTGPDGSARNLTIKNVENINVIGLGITEIDQINPVWSPSAITVDQNTSTGADITNTQLQDALRSRASDNTTASSNLVFTSTPTSFPFGTTSVQFTATDEAGNSAQATMDVTVNQTPFVIGENFVRSEDISFSRSDTAGLTDDIELEAGFRVESTDGDSGGTVTFNAGDDLLLNSTSIVQAAAGITLNVDFYGTLGSFPAPVDPDPGVGGTATLNGRLVGTSVTLNGLTDDDEFNLMPVAFSETPITINGGGGTDRLLVDLAGVTNARLIRRSSTNAVITSDTHEDITLNDVETIDTFAGSFVQTLIQPQGGTYALKSDGSGNLIFEDANGSFVIQPLASLDSVVITAGVGDDTLTVDHSAGFIPAPVFFEGGVGGNDKLSVIGNGTSDATYSPSVVTPGNGVISVADGGAPSVITFSGLEPVDVSGMDEAQLVLTGGVGDVLTVTAGNDFATDSTPALRVSGTVMGTPAVAIETAAFFNNTTLTVGADVVNVVSADNDHMNANLVLGGTNLSLAGNVTTSASLMLNPTAAITLGSDVTLGSVDVTATSTIDGAHNLAINASGQADLQATVGGTTPLTSLTTDVGGFSFFADVSTTGDQTYNDSVGINADADSTATLTAANVHFFGDVDAFGNESIAIVGNMVLGNSADDNVGEFGDTATEVPDTLSVTGTTTIATATSGGTDTILTTGDQTFTGAFTIASPSNPILTSTGGTVSFGGSIIVESGGTLTVGSVSDGSLATAGFDLQDGSTLAVNITGKATAGTDYDQIVVTGAVALNGTLEITESVSSTGAVDEEIILIDNDGTDAVTGTFTGMPNGSDVLINGEPWQLRYDGGDGNDVSLKFGDPLPSVTLSVSSNTGNEAGETVITVTVEATEAVDGDQTVDISVAGSFLDNSSLTLTENDYELSATTITIGDGQTTGTVTFTVQDDDVTEAVETAVLTISNPSSGITLGGTVEQNVAITSDEVAGVTITPNPVFVSDTGTTATVSVVLTGQPTADVGVLVEDFSATGDFTLPGGATFVDLTFTPANWDVPQEIVVTGADNTTMTGDQVAGLAAFISSDDENFSSPYPVEIDVVVTDNDSTLKVTSTTATPAGFVLEFSETVNAALINLGQELSLGAADLTVVGATTGPVRGSLLFAADSSRATFVKSSGLLAPDDYTITLRSAADGWASLGGKLLDGDGDDTSGGDFSTTITVAAPPVGTIIASVPEFTRGAGQDVVLPRTSGTPAGIPLTLSSGENVSSVSFTLNYNPALLTVTDFVSEISGAAATIDVSTPGTAIVTLMSATSFAGTAGEIVAGHFVASVPSNAPYPGKHVLDLTNLAILDNQTPAVAINAIDDDGLHVTAYFGDVSGDGAYSGVDVLLLQRIVAQLSAGAPAFRGADPAVVGDITGDGLISGPDALSIQRVIAQLDVPNVPVLPPGTPRPVANGPDPRIFIAQDLTGALNSTVTVPVQLEVTEAAGIDLGAADIVISYDPAVFSVANAQPGGLLQTPGGSAWSVTANLTIPGTIILVASNSAGTGQLDQGTIGDLFTVDFTVLPGATIGNSKINLLASFTGTGTTSTALADTNTLANLVLGPAPTNGPDDSVDGLFNVTAVAVNTAPTLTITPNSGTTSDNPIVFTFQFSEAVTGFEAGDITLTNGTAGTFTAVDADTYTLNVVPTADGAVTAAVAANAAVDTATPALGNEAATATVTSNTTVNTAPTLTITPNSGTTSDNPIIFQFQFSETVTGFTQSDVVITNGTPRSFTVVDGSTYTLSVVPASAGVVTATVAANAATDTGTPALGNVTATASVTSAIAPALAPPVLVDSPSVVDSVRPQLSWADAAGAAGYEIWFARITPSTSRLFTDASMVTSSNWTPPADLPPAHYRYWVRSVSATGAAGPWSPSQEFDVQPTLIGPMGNTLENRPTFTWEAIPNATGYEIFVRTKDSSIGNNGDIRVADIPASETFWIATQNLPEGPIRWWVRAVDSRGNRGWSAPGIVQIQDRVFLTAASATNFAWVSIPNTARYILHVEDVSNGGRTVVIRENDLTGTSFNAASALPAGNYRAWVRAITAAGEASSPPWSGVFGFTVAANSETAADQRELTSLPAQIEASLSDTSPEVAVVDAGQDDRRVPSPMDRDRTEVAVSARQSSEGPVQISSADSIANAVDVELEFLDIVMGETMAMTEMINKA